MLKALIRLCAACCMLCFPISSWADQPVPSYITAAVPHAAMVGHGHLTYMMMDIYDATLFAPNGTWDKQQPMALSISYLRSLQGSRIADQSVEEIRKQGFTDELKLAAWHSQMTEIFPDVENGTNLTGILVADGSTVFYRNGSEIGRIKDRAFGPLFFGIWLAQTTSAPQLRAGLLHTTE